MKTCFRVLCRCRVVEKSNRSVQMDRLNPPPICKPYLCLYNHLTLSISISFPPLVILPSHTTGLFCLSSFSVSSLVAAISYPSMLCSFSFILSWYQYHFFLFFPLLPRDRRHWEHGSCLSFTLVFFLLALSPSLLSSLSCLSWELAVALFFVQ